MQLSETEAFWAGEFGTEYTRRNLTAHDNANIKFFHRILQRTHAMDNIGSVIEYGAGAGSNLVALFYNAHKPLGPVTAVEINAEAREYLTKIHGVSIDSRPAIRAVYNRYDLVLTKGFLIHQPPEDLPQLYENLYMACGRYLLMCEYYCPQPREIPYRGHTGRCWARDFAGEFLHLFGKEGGDMRMIDYGFVYHRDPVCPQDDLTWWLLEKFDPRQPEL